MPEENTVPVPPVATVDPSSTAYIKKAIISLKKKAPGAVAVAFKSDGIKTSGKNEIEPLKVPGDDETGALVTIRRDLKEREETYSFKTKDVGKVVGLFGGQNVVIEVTAQIWKLDPKDAAGTCRMACEEFDATAEIDGDIEDGGQKHSEIGIKLTSMKQTGPVQWYWKPALEASEP